MEPQQPPAPTPPATPPPSAPATPPPAAPPVAPAPQAWQPPQETGPAPGVRFAGYAPRLIAYIIDVFIAGVAVIAVMVVFGIVAAALGTSGFDLLAGASIIVALLAVFVFSFAYFPYFWAKNGQTPGMNMMHIKVVRDADGGPLTGGMALLRLFGLWVNGVVFYLGYIWVFVDKRRRGWHDLIAGTVVIEQ